MEESTNNSFSRKEDDLLKFNEQKRILKELNKDILELHNICTNLET